MVNMRLFKLKPDTSHILKKWSEQLLGAYKSEVLDTLAEEQCLSEYFKVFTLNGHEYLLTHMEPLPGKELLPSNQTREINKKHKQVLRTCIDEEVSLETLYTLRLKE